MRLDEDDMMIGSFAAAVLGLATAGAASAPEVTIYSTGTEAVMPGPSLRSAAGGEPRGFAWVRLPIQLSLPEGVSEARYTDLPAAVDPSSIDLQPSPGAAVQVQAQRYQFDGGSTQHLLRRYVGRRIEVLQLRGGEQVSVQGLLLDANDGLLLQDEAGALRLLRDFADVRLPAPTTDFVPQPTVTWTLRAPRATDAAFDLRYETDAVTWWADYRLAYDETAEGCRARLSAWATVVNRSGASYREAILHLVAGQPHRLDEAAVMGSRGAVMMEAAPAADFSRQTLGDYHLYSLRTPVTLTDGAVQQLPLLPQAQRVRCQKHYRFGKPQGGSGALRAPLLDPGYRAAPDATVQAALAFENTDAEGLGVPLPAGRVRMEQSGAGTGGRFIGEDSIAHTPAGERVRLTLGEAFDLVGERTRQDFKVDQERRVMEEAFEVRLRNHKDRPVTVQVYEHLSRWRQWQVVEASQAFEKSDTDTIQFAVAVPADGETVLRYRVRYTW